MNFLNNFFYKQKRGICYFYIIIKLDVVNKTIAILYFHHTRYACKW